jgi:uncharacterized coiled-coil protein SlyX
MEFPLSASQLPLLQVGPAPRPLPGLGLASIGGHEPAARRDRVWDLSPNLHCSIIGTCLTTGALRQLFAKLDQCDAKTASDHELHSRAVRIAGQRDVAGKMLNRMLEKRHEGHVKRFAKAKTASAVRAVWLDALERGDIPGAYWATLTHPATDQALVAEAFGEVHMLSHLVGMSNRADVVRLRQLEGELGAREDKIARQEARLARIAREHDELKRRIDSLECELKRRPQPVAANAAAEEAPPTLTLKQRLVDEHARSAQLTARIAEQDQQLAAQGEQIQELEAQGAALRNELASLEATLSDLADVSEAARSAPDLAGKRLLYVGGRPKQLDQLRTIVARHGGALITHDGGMEESTTLLPGLVGQADIAFFPVNCVSHRAMGQVKRFCREAGKPFVPLRSPSVASFLVALGDLDRVAEPADAAG